MTIGISCETPSKGSVGTSWRRSGSTGRSTPARAATRAARAPRRLDADNFVCGSLNSSYFCGTPHPRSSLNCARRETRHHAVWIDEAIRRAEATTQYVVGTKLRHPRDDVVVRDHLGLLQTKRVLQRLVFPQVVEML